MLAADSSHVVERAEDIPYVTAPEAYRLLSTEFERFMALVESLGPGDWDRPTACTAWSVRDILAHQAGGYAAGSGYKETLRQLMKNRPQRGQLLEDAINTTQLVERAGRTPAELIAELRQVGPVGIQKWSYQFRLAKLVGIPHPVPGWLSIRHLLWVIHSRDTWMHRLDICRATGRNFVQTAGHDGRIAALVILDTARLFNRRPVGGTIVFDLTGNSGGSWSVGSGESTARIRMDVLDFNIFASGRYSYDDACRRAEISGSQALAEHALKNLLILY